MVLDSYPTAKNTQAEIGAGVISVLSAARIAFLDNIDNANLSTIANISTLSPTKIGYIDASINSRALASTALSSATWTSARAGYLNNINQKLKFQYVTTVQKVYPVNADPIAVTSGGAWAKGNWAQIVPASTITNAFIINSVTVNFVADDGFYEFDIGVGGGGSEVVKYTGTYENIFNTDSKDIRTHFVLEDPVYVAANARVAIRQSCNNATKMSKFKIGYKELPLTS